MGKKQVEAAGPQLGDKVKEIVTGYEGVVTGTVTYLWGCEQVCVHFRGHEGKPEADWFDIQRIEILERAALRPVVHGGAELRAVTGPDIPPPTR